MNVLILSKTQMNGGKCCVGGITENGHFVRLLTQRGENQPENTEFLIRQVWDIEYTDRKSIRPPHVEDILIQSTKKKGVISKSIKIIDFLKQVDVSIWQGGPDILFDKMIKWTNSGSGYINQEAIPMNSVGFWISDKDLAKKEFKGIRYSYPIPNGWRSLKFVGYTAPVNKIPAGTLIRVSLARWWRQDEQTEERCYLQLSGWYDYEEPTKITGPNAIDDLPF